MKARPRQALFALAVMVIAYMLFFPSRQTSAPYVCRKRQRIFTHEIETPDGVFRAFERVSDGALLSSPAVSVIILTTGLEVTTEVVSAFTSNVLEQSIFRQTEFLVITEKLNNVVHKPLWALANSYPKNFRIVQIESFPGVAKVLNFAVERLARAPLLTRWSLNELRHPLQFAAAIQIMTVNPSVDAVTCPIYVATRPFSTWAQVVAEQPLNLGKEVSSLLMPGAFWESTSSGQFLHAKPFLHAAALWKADAHTRFGSFEEKGYLSEWEFFVRASVRGANVWHMSDVWAFKLLSDYDIIAAQIPEQSLVKARPKRVAGKPLLKRDSSPLAHLSPSRLSDLRNRFSLQQQTALSVWHGVKTDVVFRSLSVLVAHERVPCDCMGGDIRVLQLVKWLRALGHAVTVVGREKQSVVNRRDTWRLQALGVTCYDDQMDMDILHTLGPFDVAFLGTWFWRTTVKSIPEYAVPILRAKSSATRVLLISDDMHHVRDSIVGFCNCVEEMKQREAQVYRDADMVLAINDEDMIAFHQFVPEAQIGYLPYVLDDIPIIPPDVDGRDAFLFAGDQHEANRLAVRFLLDDVIPIIRKSLPNAKFILAGAELWRTYSKGMSWVEAYGRVDSLEPLLARTRVFINPITVEGSGISTKSVLALTRGLPFATTAGGVRGLGCGDLSTCPFLRVATQAEDFAQGAIDLYSGEAAWSKLSALSLEHARSHFSRSAYFRAHDVVRELDSFSRSGHAHMPGCA